MDRIPARAAIDESVELAKQAGHRFASGMVNAVLRKLPGTFFNFTEGTAAELALAQAHPAWLVERWAANFGIDAARALCLHGQTQPALTVRLAATAVEDELVAAGIVLEPASLLTVARKVVSGDITTTPAFQEGRIRVQDEGSQLVAELASAAGVKKVESIVDACAAPGGKTLILAERNPHARILACESSEPRFEQLRKRLAIHADQIECRHADATTMTESSAIDLALADVPCSGTGTLGRNPEIRHRLRPEDFARQAERQRAILRAVLRAMRPGGRVLYSTCSLEPEENEQVVAALLAENPQARVVPIATAIEALLKDGILTPGAAHQLQSAITPEGNLRLIPGAFQTDGFFIAMMERTA